MPCYSHLSGPMCVYNRIWGGGLNNTEEAVFIFQPKFYSNIGMMIIFPCIIYICTIWWRSIVQCTAQEKLQECSFVVSGELIAFFLASSEKPERFKKKKDRVVIGAGLMSGSERARSLICRWQALSREKVQCAAEASCRVSLTGEAGSQPRRRWIDLDLGNSNFQLSIVSSLPVQFGIMTAEKKSGLLPRLVGGAKQKAEGMVSFGLFRATKYIVAPSQMIRWDTSFPLSCLLHSFPFPSSPSWRAAPCPPSTPCPTPSCPGSSSSQTSTSAFPPPLPPPWRPRSPPTLWSPERRWVLL